MDNTRHLAPSAAVRRFAALAAVAAAAAFAGCESAETHGVSIDVSKREVTAVGETVSLSASGWNDYEWSLSNTSIGRLSGTKGSGVVYTVLEIPAANSTHVLQTVTCQATDGGSGGGAFETVEIRHLAPEGTSGGATAPVNTASAASAPASGGSSAAPSPSGGSAAAPRLSQTSISVELGDSTATLVPVSVENAESGHAYRWSLSQSGIGRLSSATGTDVTYTPPTSTSYRGRTVSIVCTDEATQLSSTCTVSLE